MSSPSPESRVPSPEPGVPSPDTQSLGDTLRRAWRFRRYFLPFLPPALGLLLIAFIQADLLYVSTVAFSRVIDGLAVEVRARTTPTLPNAAPPTAPAPAPSGVSGSRLSLEPYVFEPLAPRGTEMPRLAAVMALFILVAESFALLREYLRTRLNERFRFAVQRDVLAALARERADTRTRRESGVTNEIFANDATGLTSLLVFGLIGMGESLVQLSKFSYEVWRVTNGLVLAIVLGIVLITQFVVAQAFLAPEARLIDTSQGLMMRFRALSMQLFENIGRLVYFRGEQREIQRVLTVSRDANAANRRFMLLTNVRGSVSGLFTQLSFPVLVVLVLAVGISDPGVVLGAERMVMMLAATVAALAAMPAMVLQYGPGLRRLEDVLNVPEPEPEPAALAPLRARTALGTAGTRPPAVLVNGVSFRYPGSTNLLLQSVHIEVPPGARVGIVGRSGCGKSTLARLLVGDVRPEAGRILVDDVDVTSWHLWWRRELVGFLPAEQGFLRGTLEENVLFGRPRESVRDLERAIELSGVANIARDKAADGGLQFALHNPTEQLSSGQRRRVGIARLLASDQPVWVFDEPGSQLDPRAMLDVAGAIQAASAGRTTLIITHDPDVFETDFNVVLRDGRVEALGTHEELLRANAYYFDLVNKNVAERQDRGQGGAPTFPPSLPTPSPAPPPPGGPRKQKVPVGSPAAPA